MNHHSPLCGARNGIQGFLYARQTYNRLSSIPTPRKFVFIITLYFLDFFKEPLLAFIKDCAYLTYYMSSLFTRCWLLLLSKFVLFFFFFRCGVHVCVYTYVICMYLHTRVWCTWMCSHMCVACIYFKYVDAHMYAYVYGYLKLTLRVFNFSPSYSLRQSLWAELRAHWCG